MNITEFRIPMPLESSLFEKGNFYASTKLKKQTTSKKETSAVLKQGGLYRLDNGKYGVYTHNAYQIGKILPGWMQSIAGDKLTVEQRCWTEFPHVRTEYTCPIFDNRMKLVVETRHVENDDGNIDNIFGLSQPVLKTRIVEFVDITQSSDGSRDSSVHVPSNWKTDASIPKMCSYKIVYCEFSYWGLQSRIQNMIVSGLRSAYSKIHQCAFKWKNEYENLGLDVIYSQELGVIDLFLAPMLSCSMPTYNPVTERLDSSFLQLVQQTEITELPEYIVGKTIVSIANQRRPSVKIPIIVAQENLKSELVYSTNKIASSFQNEIALFCSNQKKAQNLRVEKIQKFVVSFESLLNRYISISNKNSIVRNQFEVIQKYFKYFSLLLGLYLLSKKSRIFKQLARIM